MRDAIGKNADINIPENNDLYHSYFPLREHIRDVSQPDSHASNVLREGSVKIKDSTNFVLAFPFQPDGEFMSGLRGPTSGIVSWVIRGTSAKPTYNEATAAEAGNIPGITVLAATNPIRLHTIKSINFITVSDAVLSLWSPLGQGTGGALMDVQPLKITIR